MKHIISFSLICAALFSAGCGKKEAQAPIAPSSASTSEGAAAEAATAAETAPVTTTLTSIDSAINTGALDQAAASIIAVRNSNRPMTVDESLKVNDRMRQLQVKVAEMMASGDPRAKKAAQMLQASQPR
jgi:hypothetical protein